MQEHGGGFLRRADIANEDRMAVADLDPLAVGAAGGRRGVSGGFHSAGRISRVPPEKLR